MLTLKSILILWLIAVCSIIQIDGNANFQNQKLNNIIKRRYEKRPFCNAFTGCGRKRVPYPPYPILKRADDLDERSYLGSNDVAEELSDIIDINAEPAIENVQKQIMSQAKLYEAIKDAAREISRQRNRQKSFRLQQQGEGNLKQQQQSQQQQGADDDVQIHGGEGEII